MYHNWIGETSDNPKAEIKILLYRVQTFLFVLIYTLKTIVDQEWAGLGIVGGFLLINLWRIWQEWVMLRRIYGKE